MDERTEAGRLPGVQPAAENRTPLQLIGRRFYVDLLEDHLERTGRFRVVGKTSDFSTDAPAPRQPRPHIQLIDPGVTAGSIFDSMQRVAKLAERSPIAIITARWTKLMLKMALEANLRGFLLADDPMHRITESIQRMIVGERCYAESIQDEITRDPHTGSLCLRNPDGVCGFTQRELTVVKHLANGLAVKEVAAILDSTYKAIDSVKYRVMQRIGLRNRVELTRFAIREGLAAA